MLVLPPGANAKEVKPSFPVDISPEQAVERLIAHCVKMTHAQRRWMEDNPTKQMPADLHLPGKLDHSTCVVFVVPGQKVTPRKI